MTSTPRHFDLEKEFKSLLQDIVDASGPYKYLDGTSILPRAYDLLGKLNEQQYCEASGAKLGKQNNPF